MTKRNETVSLKKVLILNKDVFLSPNKDKDEKSIVLRFINTPRNEKRPFLIISDTYLLELVKYDNRDSNSVFIDNHVQCDCDFYMANKFDLKYFLVSYCFSETIQSDYKDLNEICTKLSENDDNKVLEILIKNYLKANKLDELFDCQNDQTNMIKFNLNKTLEWFNAKFKKLVEYLNQTTKPNDDTSTKITAFDLISQYLDVNLSALLKKELNLDCFNGENSKSKRSKSVITI
jgi:hypothetical protein